MVVQAPGFVNLLAGHPIETAAEQVRVPLGFWGLNGFYEPEQLQRLQDLSLKVMNAKGVRLHRAQSSKTGNTYYKTFAACKSPCTCKYTYAGFDANKAASNYGQWRDSAEPGEEEYNMLFRELLEPFQRKMNIPVEMCPDLVVGNLYGDPFSLSRTWCVGGLSLNSFTRPRVVETRRRGPAR
jgi:hypothetical protein